MRKLVSILSLIALVFVTSTVVSAARPETAEVSFSMAFDNSNKFNGTPSKKTLNVGSTLSLASLGTFQSEHPFAFWVINGIVRDDLGETDSIRVQTKLDVKVILRPANQHAVVFADSNGKMISLEYVSDNATATAPVVTSFVKPGLTVSSTNPWRALDGTTTSLEGITSSRVYVLQYESDNTTISLTISGGTADVASPKRNDVVTLTPNNTETFKYWKDINGNVLSYNQNYKFTAVKNASITAETTDATKTAQSLVNMSNDMAIIAGRKTYVGQFELHGADELIEWGFIISNELGGITLNSDHRVIAKSNTYNPVTNEFVMSFLDTTEFNTIRAYVIVQRGLDLVEIYSDNYAPKYQTINQIFSLRTNVQTYGIITGILGTRFVFISQRDGAQAIVAYKPSSVVGLAVGDEVVISGTVAEYKGFVEFGAGATITKKSSENVLPAKIDLGTDLITFTSNHQSKRYSIKGMEVIAKVANVLTLTDGVNQIMVRNDDGAITALADHLNTFNVGDLVDLDGIHLAWFDNAVFYITDVAQIAATTDNAIKEAKIIEKLDSLYGGKLFNMGTDFSPVSTLFGVAISWTIPEGLIVGGKLKNVTTDETVIITAQFTVTTLESQDLSITVKFVESQPDPIVLKQSDFGETNNSSNTNYANFYIESIENGSLDSVPTGTSSYDRAGSNHNGSSWNYLALGQKSVAARLGDLVTSNTTSGSAVDPSDPNVYVATNFTLTGVISIVLNFNTLRANTTIYLQSSTNGTDWSAVANHVQTATISTPTDITFSGLSVVGAVYYRIVFVNSSSTSSNGWLGQLTTITYYGNP